MGYGLREGKAKWREWALSGGRDVEPAFTLTGSNLLGFTLASMNIFDRFDDLLNAADVADHLRGFVGFHLRQKT